jgi:hypothetical protein
VFPGVAENELVFREGIFSIQLTQWFPKCALWIPRYPLPLPKGSMDTFLNGFFYVYFFIEGMFVKKIITKFL